MKIDNSGKPLGTSTSRTESRTSRTSTSEAGSAGTRSDNVDINAFSARLSALESKLASQPVIDENKVAEIRKAISEGRFSVQAGAIADKLMASVKELLAGKS